MQSRQEEVGAFQGCEGRFNDVDPRRVSNYTRLHGSDQLWKFFSIGNLTLIYPDHWQDIPIGSMPKPAGRWKGAADRLDLDLATFVPSGRLIKDD